MKIYNLMLLLLFVGYFDGIAQTSCPTAQFKIRIIGSNPQVMVFTDGNSKQIKIANVLSSTNNSSNEIQGYICNNVPLECGVKADTGICYFIRPLDYNVVYKIKFNAAACTIGLGGLIIDYNQNNHSFSIGNAGIISSYSLNLCRDCIPSVVLGTNVNYNVQLTEATDSIISNQNFSPSATNDIRFDVSQDGKIFLGPGFSAMPSTGAFRAFAMDGCGELDPASTPFTMLAALQGFSIAGTTMRPVLANQGIVSDTSLGDIVKVKFIDPLTMTTTYISDATIGTNGVSRFYLPPALNGSQFYLAMQHRNTIETWTSMPVEVRPPDNPINYDFTIAPSQAYGANQIEVAPGVWAFYSGDINQDENADLLDQSLLQSDIANFNFGYFATDLNGDGNVDLLDSPILDVNVNNFIFSNHP